MSVPYSQIVNQNFQAGSDYLASVANNARKAYCGYVAVERSIGDVVDLIPPPLRALQEAFVERVCGLPDEPIPLPNRPPRLPSNEGGCDCQLYSVLSKFVYPDGSEFPNGTVVMFGPVGLWDGRTPDGLALAQGFTNRGRQGGVCLPAVQRDIFSQGFSPGQRLQIVNISPFSSGGSIPIACARPTLPAPPTTTPSNRPIPPINIPSPGLPDITIPVFKVPIIIAPNITFSPRFVLDVGGVNFNFNLDGVDISYNPTFNTPITINPTSPPPTLPPDIKPVGDPGGGGIDCCDEVLAKLDEAKTLLDDIKECACPPNEIIWLTFSNVQNIAENVQPRILTNVALSLNNVDKDKTFSVVGGREVSISGWYAFGRDGFLGRRYSIQYRFTECYPDIENANEFVMSLYTGITCNATMRVVRRPEDSP